MGAYDGLILTGGGSALLLAYGLSIALQENLFGKQKWLAPAIFMTWVWVFPLTYSAWWAWVDFCRNLFK